MPPLPPPSSPSSPPGGAAGALVGLLYGVASAAAAAYSSPPRAQQPQQQEQQQEQRSPPPRPPPRAPSPSPTPPSQQQESAAPPVSSSVTPLLAALYESLLRLALRLTGLSDAVWARAIASSPGNTAATTTTTPTTTTTTTAPRLALALNGALARVSRSAQAVLGVPFLKPSLREIATYVRAVEIEAAASASLSRHEADAALALCAHHSLPAFLRAFWRRYAVAAATGALCVGLARDVILPLLLALLRTGLLFPMGLLSLFGAVVRPLLALPFVSGPLLGVAVACGSQLHGDPSWAFKEFASWARGRFVGGGGAEGAAPSSSSASSFAAAGGGGGDLGGGWADGGADVDMVDELLAEASAYLDALNNNSSGRRAGPAAAAGDAPAAVAADLGARVLRALRHRRVVAAAAASGAAE